LGFRFLKVFQVSLYWQYKEDPTEKYDRKRTSYTPFSLSQWHSKNHNMSYTGCQWCTESSSSWHWWCSRSTHVSAQTTWPILYTPTATMIRHAIGSARRPAPTTVPRTRTKFGDRAFSVAGPVVWNSLPAAVRHADSIYTHHTCIYRPYFVLWSYNVAIFIRYNSNCLLAPCYKIAPRPMLIALSCNVSIIAVGL